KKYLATGVDVNALDGFNRTPLMWALRRRNAEIVHLLLQAGSRPGVMGGYDSAITIAAEAGIDEKLLREVLAVGPRDPDHPDAKRYPFTNIALTAAAAIRRPDLIRAMVDFNAIPERDGAWQVPLDTAVKAECVDCLTAMLSDSTVAATPDVHLLVHRQVNN